MGTSFRWLVASSWTSNLGDGIGLAAGPLLVASQTSDPILVALAGLLQRLPWLLFGLYAGVLADRVDRRLIVVAVDLARAGVLAVLTAMLVTGHVNITVVLVTMFLLGTAETFADTTTGTLLPMVVAKARPGHRQRPADGRLADDEPAGRAGGRGRAVRGRHGVAVPGAGGAASRWARCWSSRMVLPPLGRPAGAQPRRPRHRRGFPVDVGQRRRPHADPGHRHVQRHLRRGLVGAGPLRDRSGSGLGAVGFGLLTTVSAVGGLLGTASYDWLDAARQPRRRSCGSA